MRITCGWVTDDGLRATKNIYTACIVFYWDVFLVFRLSVLYLGDEMTTSHLVFLNENYNKTHFLQPGKMKFSRSLDPLPPFSMPPTLMLIHVQVCSSQQRHFVY